MKDKCLLPDTHRQRRCTRAAARGRHVHTSTACQDALCPAGSSAVARPAVRCGPVRLAPAPAHLPELTHSLPQHSSRRTKCAPVSWQSSPKCQHGVTNPCWPAGLRVRGAALDQTGSQEHATVTTSADRLPGSSILYGGEELTGTAACK